MALPKKSRICSICSAEGKTEWHHIISQAKIKRLKETDHNYNNDLLNNPNNLIELCKPCHEQTDSHIYWNWFNRLDKSKKRKSRNKRTRKKPDGRKGNANYKKRKGQCLGVNANGERCGKRGFRYIGGKYCKQHEHQAPKGYKPDSTPNYLKSPPPGLRDEDDDDRYWTQEHIMTLQDIHYGVPIDKHALELFEKWSEGWKRRWLYQEKW